MILPNIDQQVCDKTTHGKLVKIIESTFIGETLSRAKVLYLIENCTLEELVFLELKANEVRYESYKNLVYLRGLIEFSNYCKQNCHYCGIRNDNKNVDRYRLTLEEIFYCVQEGYNLGYWTFVLQAGDDPYFNTERLCAIMKKIKSTYGDVAITLSIGEMDKVSYQKIYDAGCDRYLLRHETGSTRLYKHLHPNDMSLSNRKRCLEDLRDIGFQVGCGFMVNTPTQKNKDLVEDFIFIQEFQPDMCGIGPYLSHSNTPLWGNESGTINQVRFCVALTRLLVKKALLPSTTALATVDRKGRETILKAGANVIMPNLSPTSFRERYEIYEGKVWLGDEAAEGHSNIEKKIESIGFKVDMQIGHVAGWR